MSLDKNIGDEDILNQLEKGDEKAISLIYEKYAERLFISAFNMIKDKETCEDIIQEVFLNIWRKRKNSNVESHKEI